MIRKRIKSQKIGYRGSIKGWNNALADVPAFILGNCPFLLEHDLGLLRHEFSIGINRVFYHFDPTILMWQDPELWYTEKSRIPKLEAIKFCRDSADVQGRFLHFKLTGNGFQMPENPSVLHGRGSTGPLAFELAYLLGCNPIILLGMSCRYYDGKTDFYGKNPSHKPHTLRNCRRGLYWVKKCERLGRRIINCSPNNVFEETLSLEQAIAEMGKRPPQNRQSLIKRLLKSKK